MEHLGDLSASEPMYAVYLDCEKCDVSWMGCMAAAQCPKCGDTISWEEKMKRTGYYKN